MIGKFQLLVLMFIGSACFGQKVDDLKVFNHFSVTNGETHIEGDLAPYGKKINTNYKKNYYWFSGSQLHKTQGAYKGRLLHGNYSESFSNNRQLAKKGKYRNGLKRGKWYDWNEEGILQNKSHYKDGLLNRYQVSFDSIGVISKRIHYKGGIKNGQEQDYQQGKWKTTARYKNGQSVPLKESYIKRKFHAIFKKFRKKD